MALKAKSRSRTIHLKHADVIQWARSGSKITGPEHVASKGGETTLMGTQITESEGHDRGRDGNYHEGGPFHTYRSEFSVGSANYDQRIERTGAFQQARGLVFCPRPTVPIGFAPSYSSYEDQVANGDFDSLDEDGATAIAQCAPTNSASKLAILLGEIKKDGIPSLPGITTWKKRTELAKAAGSEYLNYQFGWRPLVEETLQVGNAARHSRDIVKQYQKDEGNNVRRDFDFPIENTRNVSQSSSQGATWSNNLASNFRASVGATLTREESYTRRKWFSGAFTYALPSRTDSFRRMLGYGSEADKLFGITLTPDVLWELAPWSWAADWFSNAGDVIHNATSFGAAGLVMRYGYMMCESSHTITNTINHMNLKGREKDGMPGSVFKTITKSRRPANPFGFGFTGADLSPTQIAITVALGLTKL